MDPKLHNLGKEIEYKHWGETMKKFQLGVLLILIAATSSRATELRTNISVNVDGQTYQCTGSNGGESQTITYCACAEGGGDPGAYHSIMFVGLDAKTGKRLWAQSLTGSYGSGQACTEALATFHCPK